MYPEYRIIKNRLRCFPRTRGDVPQTEEEKEDGLAFPPHTRGCTAGSHEDRQAGRVSPAHAGMYPVKMSGRVVFGGFPRTRGDVPGMYLTKEQEEAKVRRFPRTRGDVPSRLLPSIIGARFPRTRGDVPNTDYHFQAAVQFPPHTRGCTLIEANGTDGIKFPPHTRGCTLESPHPVGNTAVSPAHAGMYPDTGGTTNDNYSFPRTRGDVPPSREERESQAKFPPHTRGCTLLCRC